MTKWFRAARAKNIPLSGPVLKQKALKIAADLGHKEFEASTGWLTKFKDRHMIAFRIISGESASVQQQAVDTWTQNLLSEILNKHAPEDIFNADETGLFYQALPSKSLVIKGDSCSVGKGSKVRTELVCANMTGDRKLPLLVIGKSAQPRCFKVKLVLLYRVDFLNFFITLPINSTFFCLILGRQEHPVQVHCQQVGMDDVCPLHGLA